MLLQLSTVCSKLKQAIVLVPSVTIGINTRPWEGMTYADRLNSPLLLSWIAHARHIVLHEDTHNVPGLAELLAAAVQARSLCTICDNPLAAAEAGFLISNCRSLMRMEVVGTRPPSILPDTLEELYADFESQGSGDEADDRHVNALLYHCTRLPHLRMLRLDLNCVVPVRLRCAAQLRKLDMLDIALSLYDCAVSVQWVLTQPCESLYVEVNVVTANIGVHVAFMQQLSQVKIRCLRLNLAVLFTADLQAIWAAAQAESIVVTFAAGLCALEVLPRCATVVLDFEECVDTTTDVVQWRALSKHAGHITVYLADSSELHVTGFEPDERTLNQVQRPWQLLVRGGAGVQGLPASQPTRHAYFVQNAAAQAAGWTEELNQRS